MSNSNINSSLGLLFVFIGVYIFYTVIMLKIEIVGQQTEAYIQKVSSELEWEDYLHQEALKKISKQK